VSIFCRLLSVAHKGQGKAEKQVFSRGALISARATGLSPFSRYVCVESPHPPLLATSEVAKPE